MCVRFLPSLLVHKCGQKLKAVKADFKIPTMSKYLLGYKYIFQLLYKYSSKLQEELGKKVLGLTPKMCVEAAKKVIDKNTPVRAVN